MADNCLSMGNRNLNIQGLRGVLAIIVFLGHVLCAYNLSFIQDNMHTPLHFFYDGQTAVVVFYVLSGFYYYHERIGGKVFLKKVANKYLRIVPPYFISLIIGALFINVYLKYGIESSEYTTEWIRNFWKIRIDFVELLKQASIIFRSNCDIINPPSWYLTCEIEMMFLFPIIYFFDKHYRGATWIWLIIIVASIIVDNPHVILCSSFLIVFSCHKHILYIERLTQTNTRFFVLIGFILLNIRNFFPEIYSFPINNIYQIVQCVGAVFIVISLLQFKDNLFSNVFLVFMGNISYDFYIIHFIVLMPLLPFINSWYYCVVLAFLISIIWACFTKKIFDKYKIRIK